MELILLATFWPIRNESEAMISTERLGEGGQAVVANGGTPVNAPS